MAAQPESKAGFAMHLYTAKRMIVFYFHLTANQELLKTRWNFGC
jgi:hypothetical protein